MNDDPQYLRLLQQLDELMEENLVLKSALTRIKYSVSVSRTEDVEYLKSIADKALTATQK